MQWQIRSVSLLTIITIILLHNPHKCQIFSSTAPFNAPRISTRSNQSSIQNQSYSRPSTYQLSPAYYSMNNMQNNSINNINPFGMKSNSNHYILNSPGYSNQFKTVFRGNQNGNVFGTPRFSRLNLGVPMVNLHKGKGKIVILGKHTMKPNQSIYNGNINNMGVMQGNVNSNVIISQNGVPNTGGTVMINQGVPGQGGIGPVNGGVLTNLNGSIPVQTGSVQTMGTVIKPALVKVFFF